jgi:hypothetical protein
LRIKNGLNRLAFLRGIVVCKRSKVTFEHAPFTGIGVAGHCRLHAHQGIAVALRSVGDD